MPNHSRFYKEAPPEPKRSFLSVYKQGAPPELSGRQLF